MRIVIHDDITKDFEALGDDLKNIYEYGLAEASKNYATFVKSGYLTGQSMAKRTGTLFESVKFLRTKGRPELSYSVMPGVGVKGHLNYLTRYIGTEKEFMKPSFERWKSKKEAIRIIEDNFQKVAKERGLT